MFSVRAVELGRRLRQAGRGVGKMLSFRRQLVAGVQRSTGVRAEGQRAPARCSAVLGTAHRTQLHPSPVQFNGTPDDAAVL